MKKDEFKKYKMVVEYLIEKYVPHAKVEYSGLMTRAHGKAYFKSKRIVLSLYALEQGTWNDAMNTILHEIAHLLEPYHNHDIYWKNKYIELCKKEKIPLPSGKIQYANFCIDKKRSYKEILDVNVKETNEEKKYGFYYWVCVTCGKRTMPRKTKPKNAPYMCHHCFRMMTQWYNNEDEWKNDPDSYSIQFLKDFGWTVFYLKSR